MFTLPISKPRVQKDGGDSGKGREKGCQFETDLDMLPRSPIADGQKGAGDTPPKKEGVPIGVPKGHPISPKINS